MIDDGESNERRDPGSLASDSVTEREQLSEVVPTRNRRRRRSRPALSSPATL